MPRAVGKVLHRPDIGQAQMAGGQEAIYEYVRQKSVWIGTATEVPDPHVLR